MPIPRKFTLQTPIKVLRVERMANSWHIWLNANKSFSLGTFIQLLDNGKINRVTWHEDGTESIFEMEDT